MSPRVALLALLVGVVLLHAAGLDWVASQLSQEASVLRPMVAPMFTRVLQAQAAPAPPTPAPVAKPPRGAPARPAVDTITAAQLPTSVPAAATPTLPAPDVAQPSVPEAPAPTEAVAASAAVAATPALTVPVVTAPVVTATATLDDWPADTRMSYRVTGRYRAFALGGSARVQWQRQGDQYQARVDIDVTLAPSLSLVSQGRVSAQGLLPRAYEEVRRNSRRGAQFGEAEVTLADGRQVPRPEGMQDTASQFVELSHRFATGREALAVGRTVSFWLGRPGGLDLWTYDIVERETLQTPQLGPVEAFHLKPRPIPNPRGNITAEMWFAPSLQYLPVRIMVLMGEEATIDLLVEQIEQR